MSDVSINDHEFKLVRNYIEKQCGIAIGDEKKYLIESRMARLLAETDSSSYGDFLRNAEGSPDGKLRDKIVDAITTNETMWFRDSSIWAALHDVVLKSYVEQSRAKPFGKFRIWSAACSTGQEPYSIAMMIDNLCRREGGGVVKPENFEIVATDISPSALFIAMAGRYDKISMNRGFQNDLEEYRRTYFKQNGRISQVEDTIKTRVTFKRFNLQESLERFGRFDLILLRNVIIYFSEQFKRDLLDRMANALAKDGYLFLGTAESMLSYSSRFKKLEHGTAQYYQINQ